MRLLPFPVLARFLKRQLPTSLWGRSLLIIVLPILIMQGERDMALGDAESLYSALWRQNKDVRFITWWGEGHTVESPANLREMYRQILAWLDETAGPTLGASTPLAPPSGEASSRPWRLSSDDGSRPPTSIGPDRAGPLSAPGR